jgi:hypothetical protein
MKKLPALRLPQPPPVAPVREDDARRFERQRAPRSTARKGGSRLKRESLGERLTVYLPPKLVAAIRKRCVTERRSLSDALTEAAEAWMNT